MLVGRCWEAGGAPAYWPWVQALRATCAGTDAGRCCGPRSGPRRADLATILPELRELLPDLPPRRRPSPRARASASSRRSRRSSAAPRSARPLVDLPRRPARRRRVFAPAAAVRRRRARRRADPDRRLLPRHGGRAASSPRRCRSSRASRPCAGVLLTGLSGADTARLLELTTGDAPADELAAQVHAETAGTRCSRARSGACSPPRAGARRPGGCRSPRASGRRSAGESSAVRRAAARCSHWRRSRPRVRRRGARASERRWRRTSSSRHSRRRSSARLVGERPRARGRLRFSHMLIRDAVYESCPRPGGCACTARSARRSRRCTPETRSRTSPSSPTTTCEAGSAGAEQGDRLSRGRGRPRGVAARLRGGGSALHERAGAARDDAARATRNGAASCCSRSATSSAGPAASPRQGRHSGEPRTIAERGGPGRAARAGGARLRRQVRVGAREHRSRAGPAARACPGGGRRGGQPGARQAAGPARGGEAGRRASRAQRRAGKARRWRSRERNGDPATLAIALEGTGSRSRDRTTADERLSVGDRADRAGRAARRQGAGVRGPRLTACTSSGRSAIAPRSTSSSTRSTALADELRQPAQRWTAAPDGRCSRSWRAASRRRSS